MNNKKIIKNVWAFMYCSCIHESSYATISLHLSENGAIEAMKKHIYNAEKEFNIRNKDEIHLNVMKFGIHEEWCVEKKEIFP